MVRSNEKKLPFPPPDQATPEGLLAIGGDLSTDRLLDAYRMGIFPWYNPGQPVLWWSPDPRVVLYPDQFRLTRSLAKRVRNGGFTFTMDRAFDQVIRGCAEPRHESDPGTWITADMNRAYIDLHELGYAHSVEVWHQGSLCGGLYLVSLGRVFFGESMFSRVRDSSKAAFYYLCCLARDLEVHFIDCQLPSDHLFSLGAQRISRRRFLDELAAGLAYPDRAGNLGKAFAQSVTRNRAE